MAFNLAGAGAGAADALTEYLTRAFAQRQAEQAAEMERQRLAQQGAQFDARMGMDRDQLAFAKQQHADDQAYRTGQVDRQLAADRQAGNERGTRRMIGEFLVQRGSTPLDTGARQTLQGMALQEGVDLPSSVTRDPEAEFAEQKRIADYEHGQRLAEIREQGNQSRLTAGAKTAPAGPTPYSVERAARTLQSVRELKGQVSRWTTGAGSLLSGLPETDARNFRAQLDTLKSNIAFNELAEMREASKTGGALGAVSERELGLLESTLGALDQAQSPEAFAAQLAKIEQSLTRWNAAKVGGGGRAGTPAPMAPVSSHGGAATPRFQILSVQ